MTAKARVAITRRGVVVGIVSTLAGSVAAGAQPVGRTPRVSIYSTTRTWSDAIREALVARGWTEGRTISFEWYSAEDSHVHIGEHTARSPADVIVVGGPHRVRAAMRTTATIPIVALDLESDPVVNGFVKTLARPGGNVSGVWMDQPEIAGKQIQFLREALPKLQRLGVIWDDRIGQPQFAEVQRVCRASNLNLHQVPLHTNDEVDDVMKRLGAERPQGIVLLTAPVVSNALLRIAELTLQARLPTISPFSTFPGFGGLMAYGPDFAAMWRQIGDYVDRVLRGAKVGDLPVERPSKFTLIVNLKTAKTLGLTLPPPLVLRADEVIK
jgi:putative ABC transport system substrate-binding protein